MKKLYGFCGLIVILALLTGCRYVALSDKIGESIGIELPLDAAIEYWDTHGGFHGDGESFARITLPENASEFTQQVLADGWHRLSKQTDVHQELEGSEFEALLPKTEKGYWYLWDRSPDDALEPADLNITLAVFDTSKHTLYVYEKDL